MNRFAYTIFCDDIRNELNGKVSLMGLYHGSMYFPTFPASLSKLCIVTNILTPFDRPLDSVEVIGRIDEQEIFRIEIAEEQLKIAATKPAGIDQPETMHIQAVGIASPITFDKPCKLSISVIADGKDLGAPGLHVIAAPPQYTFA